MCGKVLASFLLTAAALAAPLQAAETISAVRPPKIPTDYFAEQPLLNSPKLSPSGDSLLFRFERNGIHMIGVQSFSSGTMKSFAAPAKAEVAWARWAGNDRILVSVASVVLYFDEEARLTRLLMIHIPTGEVKFLGKKDEGLEGDDVLFVDPSGEWLLLSIQRTIYDYPSVYRVDLATGAMKEVVRQRPDVWEWYADERGVVRLGVGFSLSKWSLVYRRTREDDFRRVIRAKYDDEAAALDFFRFANDSDTGYVLSNLKTGRFALYKYDFAKRELGDLVYEHPVHDLNDFDLSEDGKSLRAVRFADDRERVVWFDDKLKTYQQEIDAALEGRMNWIVSRSRDDKRMIVYTASANDPGSYYVYFPDAGRMQRIAKVNERLKPSQLAPSRYVTYKARDGLEIRAYLTLPPGREAKNLPLVILPHGGPYGVRDTLDFDIERQFLANRGYVVLQPNYRGSGGYGKDFYERGEGQIGRRMQDDLDDGMDWLVKAGTVDPKRVCIVGSSYGGYAALWGATRNPERYRCAASFAGVTDYRRQVNYNNQSVISARYRKDWRETVQGAKDFNLDSVSPLKQVAQLRVPVLIAHGKDDSTVLYKQSALYAAALKRAAKPYEFYSYEDEGHGFSSKENLRDWLNRLEAFLAKHNPAG